MMEVLWWLVVAGIVGLVAFFVIILIQNPQIYNLQSLSFLFWKLDPKVFSWYFLVLSVLLIVIIIYVYWVRSVLTNKINLLKSKLYDLSEGNRDAVIQELKMELEKLREELHLKRRRGENGGDRSGD